MSDSRTITQRIALDGLTEIVANLKSMGDVGEKAIKQISDASAASNAPLSRLSSLSQSIVSGFQAVGTAFAAMGPILENLGKKFETLGGDVESMGIKLGTLGVAAAAGVFLLAQRSANAVVETTNLAASLGLAIDKFEALSLVANQSGVDTDKFDTALAKSAVTLGAAQEAFNKANGGIQGAVTTLKGGVDNLANSATVLRGNLTNAAAAAAAGVTVIRGGVTPVLDTSTAYAKLGISLIDATGKMKDLNTVNAEVAAKLAGIADPATKAAIAAEIFGRGWRAVLPVFDDLKTKTDAAGTTIERFGIGVTGEELAKATAFKAGLATMTTVLGRESEMFGNTIGTLFTPVFNAFTELLGKNTKQIQALASGFVSALMPAVNMFIAAITDSGNQADFFGTLNRGAIAFEQFLVNDLVPGVQKAFAIISSVIGGITDVFNKVFGTDLSKTTVAIILVVGLLSGAFTTLAAVLGVVIAAVGVVIAAVGAFGGALTALVVLVVAAGAAFWVFRDDIVTIQARRRAAQRSGPGAGRAYRSRTSCR